CTLGAGGAGRARGADRAGEAGRARAADGTLRTLDACGARGTANDLVAAAHVREAVVHAQVTGRRVRVVRSVADVDVDVAGLCGADDVRPGDGVSAVLGEALAHAQRVVSGLNDQPGGRAGDVGEGGRCRDTRR